MFRYAFPAGSFARLLALNGVACVLQSQEPERRLLDDPIHYTGWNTGQARMDAEWTLHDGNAPVPEASAPADSDGDGLPDEWESSVGFGLAHLAAGPRDDPDGDGLPNLVEYACGLDPRTPDTQTALQMRPDVPEPGESAGLILDYRRLRFPGSLVYSIATSTDLATWFRPGLVPEAIIANDDGITEAVSVRLPLVAAWGRVFARLEIDAPATPNTQFFLLNNGLVWRGLDRPAEADFDLRFDASHTDYQRAIWAGLFNADGTQGYAVRWDSSVATAFGGGGHVSIRRYTVAAPASTNLTYANSGTQLGALVGSGHNIGIENPATSLPFAKIRLTWSRDVGALRLYVNDVLKQTVYDTSYSSFSRLYVGGSTGSKLDNFHATVPGGAAVPFTTIEAEGPGNNTNGTIIAMTSAPAATTRTPELEASGRAFVRLAATGQQLTIPNAPAATALVLRHCIPDAAGGGGTNATLNLYVNGAFRQSLTLPSAYNWLYGPSTDNGQSNAPADGVAHVFWDETAYLVSGGIQSGDTVMLRKDAANVATYYSIDLVDFETAPAALPPPAAGTYYSVTDYGANGADGVDDTAAIANCINAARAAGRTVWIPAGTYRQSARFIVNGVTIKGAGMWHAKVLGLTEGTDWAGTLGFEMSGTGSRVSDLAIDSLAHTRRSNGGKAFSARGANNWSVENVWIMHTNSGLWMSLSNGGAVRGCRVRGTYADGINLNTGSSGNLVEHNHVRGCGDDSIAVLSDESVSGASSNNIVRHNSAIANWWGHNADLAGGSGNVFEYNYLADNALMGAFTINLPAAYPMHPVTGALIRRNLIVRGGGNFASQQRGAIWLFPGDTTIANVAFEDNYVKNPVFRGIHLAGSRSQQYTFLRNRVEKPGGNGIHISGGVVGAGTFTGNVVTGVPSGFSAFNNAAGATFGTTFSGNDF